ncbi:MAG: putative Ig domain-containing protein [Polaromonas sp.]|uniref:VCBS domain-containing protein n=1 Tax=Polaromonas sp. TaxID=1869339 RepID=UPI0025D61899|nr:VCBS domain-containing protein [Polaromonas sp.]MBI2727867.1 putative Ig domain-containing protein [Polaromonas sp.]
MIADVQTTYNLSSMGTSYDDVLMGDDKTNKDASGEYQLNGRNGKDVLIGNAGDDILDGGDGADFLIGGADNDTLKGGAGKDTYVFKAGEGTDTIEDSDGEGEIRLAGNQLKGTSDPSKYELKDGIATWKDAAGISYNFRDDGKASKVELTIKDGTLGSGKIVIKDFDLDKAKTDSGYLGITLKRDAKGAIVSANQTTPFNVPNPTIAGLNKNVNELAGIALKWFGNIASGPNDTLTLTVKSGDASCAKVCTGAETLDLSSPVVIELDQGQTERGFSIISDSAIDSDQTLELVATYTHDGVAVDSNTFTLNLKDTGEIGQTYTGDQRAKLIGTEIDPNIAPDNPRFGTYKWSATSWANDGTLNGGIQEDNFADVIYGSSGNDRIDGKGGNDALAGGAGNDQIDGGDGDDMIAGGAGTDSIKGGAGNDYISSSAELQVPQRVRPTDSWSPPAGQEVKVSSATWGVYLDGEAGSKVTVWAGIGGTPSDATEGDTIDAGAGNDAVIASWGNDRIQGGDGDDQLDGLAGDDIIEGGDGDDVISADGIVKTGYLNTVGAASHGADFVDGGDGKDNINGGGGSDELFGGDGDDQIWGDSGGKTDGEYYVDLQYHGNDYLDGEGGDDYLEGGGKDDTLYGGAGKDNMWGDTSANNVADGADTTALWGNDYMDGEDGDDVLIGGGKDDTLYGGTGNDVLAGDEDNHALKGEDNGFDYLDGEDGDDVLIGGGKDDTLFGGKGNDQLLGDTNAANLDGQFHGNDYLDGEDGNDLLIGGGGGDTLYGGAGNDELQGDANDVATEYQGADYLNGEAGDDRLFGQGGDDTLLGGEGADYLAGGEGSDSLAGGAGNDELDGGEGDDTLTDTEGDNKLFGGDGNDSLVAGAGDDQLSGEAGDDTIDAGEGNNLLFGGDGSDTLVAGAGNDQLSGEAGDDTIDAGEGNNLLFGGDGNDTLMAGAGRDQLSGDAGDDTIDGGAGDDRIYGDAGNDALTGGDGNDYLDSGSGNDFLNGGAGNDRYAVLGSTGTKHIIDSDGGIDRLITDWNLSDTVLHRGSLLLENKATGQQIHIDEFDMNDPNSVCPIEEFQFIGANGSPILLSAQQLLARGIEFTGTPQDDVIIGTAYNDLIDALQSEDQIDAAEGNNTVNAGDGDDSVIAGDGNNIVSGGAGDDSVTLGAGHNTVHGDDGDDAIYTGDGGSAVYGDQGNDTLVTGAGADVLDGGASADVMAGGAGSDTYYVDNADDAVIETQPVTANGAQDDTVIASINYQLAENVEILQLANGAASAIIATGNDADNKLRGNEFDNLLLGGAGQDTLTGNAGNDVLDGGTGADYMDGGEGDDTYVVDDAHDETSEMNGDGHDTVYANADHTIGVGIEDLVLTGSADVNGSGNDSDNTITGNDGANVLFGGLGTDTLYGGAGNDVFLMDGTGDVVIENAGQGMDTVRTTASYTLTSNVENLILESDGGYIDGTGNELGNALTGNEYDNRLDGGAGVDTLTGGDGNDTYVVDSTDDLVIENAGPNAGNADQVISSSVDYALTDNVENLTLAEGSAALFGTGNALDNTITGNSLDNQLYGGAGVDLLDGNAGSDLMAGGTGNDTYIVDNVGDVVFENTGEGIDLVLAHADHTLSANVENLTIVATWDDSIGDYTSLTGIGNELGNVLTGDYSNDTLYGMGGDDTLYGLYGNDTLYGDAGNDLLEAAGNGFDQWWTGETDLLVGGMGNDVYRIDSAYDQIFEDADGGTDTVYSYATYTALSDNVEDLVIYGDYQDDYDYVSWGQFDADGNALDNTILGNDARNTLSGYGGNDNIDGAAGNDAIYGGDGNDILFGGADALHVGGEGGGPLLLRANSAISLRSFNSGYGGAEGSVQLAGNNDYIDGGAGDDQIDGGSGDDTLLGGDGDDVLYGGDNRSALLDPDLADYSVQGVRRLMQNGVAAQRTLDSLIATFGLSQDIASLDAGYYAYPAWQLSATPGEPAIAIPLYIPDWHEGEPQPSEALYIQPDGSVTWEGGGAFQDYELAYWNPTRDVTWEDLSSQYGVRANTDGVDVSAYIAVTATFPVPVDVAESEVVDEYRTVYWPRETLPGETDWIFETLSHRGMDTLDGGAGDDALDGGGGDDTLLGGDGADTLYGGDDQAFNVVVDGFQGEVVMDLGTFAASNNDYLDGGAGIDTLTGGTGDDTYVVDGVATANPQGRDVALDLCDSDTRFGMDVAPVNNWVADRVVELAGQGNDTVYSSASIDLSGQEIETVNLLDGGPVADIDARTGDGSQVLNGNTGRNALDGGAGADVMTGGLGDDTYYVDDAGDVVVELADEGIDTVHTSLNGYTLGNGFENLVLEGSALAGSGNALDNILIGNALDNVIDGGDGSDTLAGWRGNDLLRGGAGADIYAFGRGDGQDVVVDTEGMGELHFGDGISLSDLRFVSLGNDLVIELYQDGIKTTDQITLQGWAHSPERISSIAFCDAPSVVLDESLINHAPVAVADVAQVTEDLAVQATGNVLANDSDPDAGQVLAVSNPGTYAGVYGSLVMGSDGGYTYQLNNALAQVQALAVGQTLNEQFSYTVQDNAGSPLTAGSTLSITITGSNDGPIAAVDMTNVGEDGVLIASGNVLANDSDIDVGDTLTVAAPATLQGTYGSLVLASNGSYSYTLNNTSTAVQGLRSGQQVTDSFAYSASDGLATSAGNLLVTVTGSNDGPKVVADVAAVGEDGVLVTTGNVLANDIDIDVGDTLTVAAPGTLQGTYGSLALTANGSYTYTLNNAASAVQSLAQGQTALDQFSYTAKDNAGNPLSATSQLSVTVTGANDAPIVVTPLADQSGREGQAFNFVVAATAFKDIDQGDVLTYSARLVDANGNAQALPGWLSFNATTRTFSGTPDSAAGGTYTLRVIATDRQGANASDDFALTVADDCSTSNGTVINGRDCYNDVLNGTACDDVINGKSGNDKLYGNGGNDRLDGGTGSDVLDGGAGNDTLVFGADDQWGGNNCYAPVTSTNVGSPGVVGSNAQVDIDGYARSLDVFEGGAGVDTLLGSNGDDAILLDDGSTGTGAGARVKNVEIISGGWGDDVINLTSIRYAYGDVTLTGGAGNDTLWSGAGNDVLQGNEDCDTLDGGAGNDLLQAGTGDDFIDGRKGLGNDINQGQDGNDTITDMAGPNLLDGGAGQDTMTDGDAASFFFGGKQNDTITTGKGADLIAFNRGDGADTIYLGAESAVNDTLSLGMGIKYASLKFKKSGNDLILDMGTVNSVSDKMTLKNWYSSASNRTVAELQVMTAGGDYDANSSDQTRNKQVEVFDFTKLVQKFDAARAANSANANGWAMMNSMLDAHLQGSNTQALGGDLAFQYGTAGSLAGIGLGVAQASLAAGTDWQNLQSRTQLEQGAVRLV